MIQDFFSTHNFNLIQILIVAIGYLMPIPLAFIAFHLWHHYRQERFIMSIKWVLLEIQVPRDVIKTPASMELIFSNAFYHKSMKGFWEEFMVGAPWLWFSLELVSIEGRVHFYIRTPTRIRDLVETQIYAQYPQAKIVEVDDYVFNIPQYKKDGNWNMWGCEFTKMKDDVMPIKTYKQIEELKTGTKEEFKVDPITPIIEYLGSLSKGKQMWVQIVIRQSLRKYPSRVTGKRVNFETHAEEYMKNLLAPFTKIGKGGGVGGGDSMEIRAPGFIEPSIKAMAATLGQIHFDCGIRLITLADKRLISTEQFNSFRRSSRLIFRQFAQPYSNELDRRNSTQFDAPWSDPTGLALTKIKKRMLNFYRMRTFFHPPIQYTFKYPAVLSMFFPSGKPNIFVLSNEELASLYHFPGMVSETPSFKRIESKIAKPPSNLPI
ncbi:MAG: hypothetical protein WC839_03960 [Candidatus Paceibacterota bacterium]